MFISLSGLLPNNLPIAHADSRWRAQRDQNASAGAPPAA